VSMHEVDIHVYDLGAKLMDNIDLVHAIRGLIKVIRRLGLALSLSFEAS